MRQKSEMVTENTQILGATLHNLVAPPQLCKVIFQL